VFSCHKSRLDVKKELFIGGKTANRWESSIWRRGIRIDAGLRGGGMLKKRKVSWQHYTATIFIQKRELKKLQEHYQRR